MAATVTVTGTAGPGNAVTAGVFTGVTEFTIDADKNMIYMSLANGVVRNISVAAATTVTSTKSGSTWTLVIS